MEYQSEEMQSKYAVALSKYNTHLHDDEVQARVDSLITKHLDENNNIEVKKELFSCIDLTSLKCTDSEESIMKLTEKVNEFVDKYPDLSNVAAICVYPIFVETVKQALRADKVHIASVCGGFPASQTFTEIKVAETAMAVMEGADEIDTVINIGYFLEENYEELCDELEEIKSSCREGKMKVIIESGALVSAENIRKASILAAYSGADFIKTSTGKGYPGATPEAAYTICKVIKQYHELTGNKIGIKVAGGIRTAEDAVNYYTIVKEILGEEWLNSDLFRIGASSLVQDIEKRLGK